MIALESLSVRHEVECKIREVLYSYYLKEHDMDKGKYQIITRVGRVPIITCLRTTTVVGKIGFSLSEES